MTELVESFEVDWVDVVIVMNLELNLDGVSRNSDNFEDLSIENHNCTSVEANLLLSFYSREGTLLLGLEWSLVIRDEGWEFLGGDVQFHKSLSRTLLQLVFISDM